MPSSRLVEIRCMMVELDSSEADSSHTNWTPDRDQAARQVDALWGDQAGIAYLATKLPGKKGLNQGFYDWPEQRDLFLDAATRQAPTVDVYLGVLLHSKRDGKKPSCLPGGHLWADVDADRMEPIHVDRLEEVIDRAHVVASGRPGHVHVYLPLEVAALPVNDIEHYNKRLATWLGADPSGHDAAQLLRLAGTWNHPNDKKPEWEGGPVTLAATTDAAWSLEELDALLPYVDHNPGGDNATPFDPTGLPDESAEELLERYADQLVGYVQAYFDHEPDEDWSKSIWTLELGCIEAGMTAEETFIVAKASACNKYDRDQRGDEALWKEVQKAERYVRTKEAQTAATEPIRDGDRDQEDHGRQETQVANSGMPSLDPAAFYGLAGDVVRTLAPHTEASDAALLVPFLVMFGNVVGREPYAEVGSAEHPGKLSALLVGQTGAGGRKGTGQTEINGIMKLAAPTWFKDRKVSGMSSGEGIIGTVRDQLVTEGQGETLVVRDVADKRLMVIETEFARALVAANRQGSTLSAVMREAFDSPDLNVLTKDRQTATGTHISIIGHITTDELKVKLSLTDAANGFGNRFLYVLTKRSKLLPHGGKLPTGARERLAARVKAAITAAQELGSVVLQRSPAADAIWERAYREWAQRPSLGMAGALTQRADAITLRLSVIYALLDGSRVIEAEHVKAALAVWRYCEQSVRSIFGESTGNDYADRILEELESVAPKWVARSEFNKRLFSNHATKAELDQAIALLLAAGVIEDDELETAGRKKQVRAASKCRSVWFTGL
jgi:hypothetical protein